jgi:hypothetical protein
VAATIMAIQGSYGVIAAQRAAASLK